MIKLFTSRFDESDIGIALIAKELGITNEIITEVAKVPLIDNNKEVLFAIALQNLVYGTNKDRKDAIAKGKYIEITSIETAH